MSSSSAIRRRLSGSAADFIDEAKLHGLLAQPAEPGRVREIIAKSLSKEALTVE